MAYSNERELDIEDELNEFAEDSLRSLALNFIRNVTFASPVDTGRFRANWNFAVGTPNDSFSPSKTNPATNLSYQSAEILRATIDSSTVMWVSNNLPYAARLNDGWSKQAPAFFVEKAARISGIDIPDGTL
jgi:hypothetical protein